MYLNLSVAQVISLISIFQLIVFVVSLISGKFNRLPSRLLAAFLLLQVIIFINFLVQTLITPQHPAAVWFLLFGNPAFLIVSPILFFYVRSLCYSDFKLKLKDCLHFLPAMILIMIIPFLFLQPHTKQLNEIPYFQELTQGGHQQCYFALIMYAQFLIYNVLSLKVIARYRRKLKMQVSSTHGILLSWLKFIIIGFTVAWLINCLVMLLSIIEIPLNFDMATISFSSFLLFFNILFFKGWTQSDIFSVVEETKKYVNSSLSEAEAEKYLKMLQSYFEEAKPYLDPQLTLKKLSESVSIPQRLLSQLINEQKGMNFYDFVNSYRIEIAKKMLVVTKREKTISEIMYDSGFNTKSSFNTAFKNATGVSPTEYRKKNAC